MDDKTIITLTALCSLAVVVTIVLLFADEAAIETKVAVVASLIAAVGAIIGLVYGRAPENGAAVFSGNKASAK